MHDRLERDPRRNDASEVREVPVLRPQLPTAERLLPYLARIDRSRCYSNWGPLASELEQRLADRFQLRPRTVVSASSGTAALVGAILARAGRATADRPLAILPAFTFVAPALALEQCGYRVYLVDVHPGDWMIHAEQLLGHPALARTGLVVPVSSYGRLVRQAEWLDFEQRTGVPVVIDGAASFEIACACPDAMLGPIPVTLSFHATKAFACAEGGCVVSTDVALGDAVTRALNFGFFESRDARAAAINGKLSEYHAAVGLAELDGWEDKREAFARVARLYRDAMRLAGLSHRLITVPEVASCYVLFRASSREEAQCIAETFEARRIGIRTWYGSGVHRQAHFLESPRDDLGVTDDLGPTLIGLPVAPDLDPTVVTQIVGALAAALARDADRQGDRSA
jgi:dTDP-4-amino-4,6-dideoxygalactose transaminase